MHDYNPQNPHYCHPPYNVDYQYSSAYVYRGITCLQLDSAQMWRKDPRLVPVAANK